MRRAACFLVALATAAISAPAAVAATWSPQSFPGLAEFDDVGALSAPGPGDVWAAGEHYTGSDWAGRVWEWDGAGWVPRFRLSSPGTYLTALYAATSADVWVGGSRFAKDGRHGFFAHRVGRRWRIVRAPAGSVEVVAVSGAPGRSVWAVVGLGLPAPPGERWEVVRRQHGRWAVARRFGDWMTSILVTARGIVWVGGDVLARWDGRRWTVRPIPGVIAAMAPIPGDDRIWAVGNRGDDPCQCGYRPLLVRAGATETTVIRVAGGSTGVVGALTSVAAASRGDAWATGAEGYGDGPSLTLHLRRGRWVAAPSSLLQRSYAPQLAAASGVLWAVGPAPLSGGMFSAVYR